MIRNLSVNSLVLGEPGNILDIKLIDLLMSLQIYKLSKEPNNLLEN